MKVWCEFVFGKCHQFILDQIAARKYDLYLLCNIDLPWIKDELREYPDLEIRKKLYSIYRNEMQHQSTPWVEISGSDEERLEKAIAAVRQDSGVKQDLLILYLAFSCSNIDHRLYIRIWLQKIHLLHDPSGTCHYVIGCRLYFKSFGTGQAGRYHRSFLAAKSSGRFIEINICSSLNAKDTSAHFAYIQIHLKYPLFSPNQFNHESKIGFQSLS